MKKLILFALALCTSTITYAQSTITPAAPGVTYGKTITADNAITTAALSNTLSKTPVYTGKLTGKVVEVCQVKGCFVTLQQPNGKDIMVKFTDYAYFLPKNIVGKTVVIEGKTTISETSVERLKHYAKDAGKSKKEIAMITKPKKDISVMADGVLVVD